MHFSAAALSPCWDTRMNFNLSVPELCLVRFCVCEQTSLLSSKFVGQYTLPFTSLKKGEPQGRKGHFRCVDRLYQITLCSIIAPQHSLRQHY